MCRLPYFFLSILLVGVSGNYEDVKGRFVFTFHENHDVVVATDGLNCYFFSLTNLRNQGLLHASYDATEAELLVLLNGSSSAHLAHLQPSSIDAEYHDDIANILCRGEQLYDVDVVPPTTPPPCVDTVGGLTPCSTLPDICLSPSAPILCRKYCGLCGGVATTHQPTTHQYTTTLPPVHFTTAVVHTNQGNHHVTTAQSNLFTNHFGGPTTHRPIQTTTHRPIQTTTYSPIPTFPTATTPYIETCVDLYRGDCRVDYAGQCGNSDVQKACKLSCNLCVPRTFAVTTHPPAVTFTYPPAVTTTPPGGLMTFGATNPPGHATMTAAPQGSSACIVNGVVYADGAVWTDGCTARYLCINAQVQQYARCYTFNLPPECSMVPPTQGKCCFTPNCPPGISPNYPNGWVAD